jgi:hypothetical protein
MDVVGSIACVSTDARLNPIYNYLLEMKLVEFIISSLFWYLSSDILKITPHKIKSGSTELIFYIRHSVRASENNGKGGRWEE